MVTKIDGLLVINKKDGEEVWMLKSDLERKFRELEREMEELREHHRRSTEITWDFLKTIITI